jgi:hypothetical protein
MANNSSETYWKNRKDSIYLFAAKIICKKYGAEPKTVIDVGSNSTPTLEWHRDTAEKLVSVDLVRPYISSGIESHTMNFFDFKFDSKFDLVTCFQVLEHIPDPKPFARKLLGTGKIIIVSVPYKWQAGACKYHIHDPVTNKKMLDWFGIKPIYTYLATEINKVQRIIHVYREH